MKQAANSNAKRTFLIVIICSLGCIGFAPLEAQDTVSVYFSSGSPKLEPSQFETLNSMRETFDLSLLRGVRMIGMADSVGSGEDNLKLSERRARHVARYCKRIFPRDTRIKIAAMGERPGRDRAKSRRVDVVLYFRDLPPEDTLVIESDSTPATPSCFYIDYKLLHRAHVRTILRRGKEFAMIETQYRIKGVKHYWAKQNEAGEPVPQIVKWRPQNNGMLWWKDRRRVTRIPMADFDRYQIFTMDTPPCTTCSEQLLETGEVTGTARCLQVDRFLMNNLQFRRRWFFKQNVKVRVPREYVNIDAKYFIGCDPNDVIKWYTRRGPRRKNYYYTHLPQYDWHIANITRMMKCCAEGPEPSECDVPRIWTRMLCGMPRGGKMTFEIGNNLHQDRHRPYVMGGFSLTGHRSVTTAMVGTDVDLGAYGSLRYQYHYLRFPFYMLSPGSRWQRPEEKGLINVYGGLYAGAELRTRLFSSEPDFLEQNVHLGFAVINARQGAFFNRVFIQQGIAVDYMGNNAGGIYFPAQLGVQMNLVRLWSK